MIARLLLSMCLLAPPALFAQEPGPSDLARVETRTVVFREGDGAYASYRIPALLRTRRGTLLAFCEGRKAGRSDTGDIDLVLRRSTDEGRTWSDLLVVRDAGEHLAGNPCVVEDARTGTLILLSCWNAGNDTEARILAGQSETGRRVFVQRSEDDGQTWSPAEEITEQVTAEGWTWYATGPGIGIQLRKGAHAGRLVFPANHARVGRESFGAHVLLSDDGGRSFRLGGRAPGPGVNESQIAERPDGSLVLNSRNYDRSIPARKVCASTDGGESFASLEHEDALVEPICQASLLAPPPGVLACDLLFANPADARSRRRYTVKHHEKNGWAETLVLHEGPAAYGCLSPVRGSLFGALFECGEDSAYERIEFASFRFLPPLGRAPARVEVIGASVSAGFTDPRKLWRNLTRPLSVGLRAAWTELEATIRNHSTSLVFQNPRRHGRRQMEALDPDADLVIGLDWPFWFGYGRMTKLETRRWMQRFGLSPLEKLAAPVLLGDYPDMHGADETMLPRYMIPPVPQIQALNASLREWAEPRANVHLFPLSRYVVEVRRKGIDVPWRGGLVRLPSENLLQSDRLHATALGVAALSWRLHGHLREVLPLDHPARPGPRRFEDFVAPLRLTALLERFAAEQAEEGK